MEPCPTQYEFARVHTVVYDDTAGEDIILPCSGWENGMNDIFTILYRIFTLPR